MILSMTSFARREKETPFGSLRWELRSVNHRYLDVSLRLPEDLRILETKVREQVAERLSRGKVECNLRYQALEQGRDFAIDHEMVKRLGNAVHEASIHIGNPAPVNYQKYLQKD